MTDKDAQVREALTAAREEIQTMRRQLELANARLSTLDSIAYITGMRSMSGGSGWPNVLKMIDEALEPERDPVPQSRGLGVSGSAAL